ncbi:MAG: hypothetical protein Q8Q09_11410 [Deltaproteobacteria bacterium]|nr:hypothetical protein [Deltaproteobacteria bacterium]
MRAERTGAIALLIPGLLFACQPRVQAQTGQPNPGSSGGAIVADARPVVPAWVSESVARACRDAPEIHVGETVRGRTGSRSDDFHATCGFGAVAHDAVYRLRLERASQVTATTRGRHDTVLSLRALCHDDTTELACNDDEPRGTNSRIDTMLPAGDYTLVVDGFGRESNGDFELNVQASPAVVDTLPESTVPRVPEGQGVTVTRPSGAVAGAAVTGEAHFAKRSFTERGLSRAVQWLPAAHAHVDAIDDNLRVVAEGATDERGAFSLTIPAGQRVHVRLQSRTTLFGSDLRVVSDPGTERTYDLLSPGITVEGGERVVFRADVGGVEPAGAFNILANFVRYLPHTHTAFEGATMPPLFAFWRRGNNRALPQGNITAFLGAYPRHAGSYALQIQGGDLGREDLSDSDQFDDPVVLHEFSHYVVGTMSGRYSIGGNHPGNGLYFPGLAMDEGFANALACAVAGSSRYWDTAGVEPIEPLAQAPGRVLLSEDMERLRTEHRGIGSQDVAQTLLWDLMDGDGTLPDQDNDGVSIGLTNALKVYRALRSVHGLVGINGWLSQAVQMGLVTEAQARALVRTPEHLGFAFPVPEGERWPEELVVGRPMRGRIDGRTQPAPSGGRNNVYNGYDASRTYRLNVTTQQRVTLTLDIDGAGTQESHTDVDLQLFSSDFTSIANSSGTTPHEEIVRDLAPGQYVVLVRDGSMASNERGAVGNRTTYTIRAR